MNHRNSTTTTTTYGSGNFVTETVELERVHLTSSNAEDEIIDDDGDGDGDDYEGDDHDYDEYDHDDDECDDDDDDMMYCCTWKEYFISYRFIELNICFWPCLLVVLYLDYIYYQPRERPIPYEHLGMTGGMGIGIGITTASSTIKNNAGDDDDNEDTNEESIHSYPNIVWNLVNNEKFLGDTISSTECKLYALILPLMLQLSLVWFLWILPPGSNPVATTTVGNNNSNNNNKLGNNNNSIDLGLFHRWDGIHRTICVYSVGFGITEVITCSVKYYVGYLRPIFLDICQPYYDASSSDGGGGGGGEFRCTNEYEAKGARISFPSNHASGSFCGMLLLSLYLEHCFGTSITHPTTKTFLRKKKLPRRRQQQIQDHAKHGLQRLVSLFCYTPMLFAVFIAASRVVDNRHFPADVVGGAVLGASIASLVFNIWYVINNRYIYWAKY
ncbi:MAG: membrane-associated phospholipid phosphatase [Bacillariaceae sp.]|jgi:membrane-associated phospholipid phosphatase